MSKDKIPYFNFYPTDFMHGVRGMSAQEVGIYTMILCRIYEESGPVEYNELRLSTYCGTRIKTFSDVVKKLVALGRIILADGMISDDRAEREISSRADKLKLNSMAGKASAEKRQQNQQNISTDVQRTFNHTDTDTDTDILEKETNVSLSSASEKTNQKMNAALALSKYGIKPRGETHKERAMSFIEACNGVDDVSFIAACERYLSGKVVGHNPKFAPTAGELAALARLIHSNALNKTNQSAAPPDKAPFKTKFQKKYDETQNLVTL